MKPCIRLGSESSNFASGTGSITARRNRRVDGGINQRQEEIFIVLFPYSLSGKLFLADFMPKNLQPRDRAHVRMSHPYLYLLKAVSEMTKRQSSYQDHFQSGQYLYRISAGFGSANKSLGGWIERSEPTKGESSYPFFSSGAYLLKVDWAMVDTDQFLLPIVELFKHDQ